MYINIKRGKRSLGNDELPKEVDAHTNIKVFAIE